MPTTNVKIFTGFVQQEQLAQDMGYLKRSLNKLRAIFATRGVRLRTDQCDTNDPEQIRESVADSDVCVFLFQNDVPDLARAQFDAAYAQLVSGVRAGSPSIFVWFRDVDDAQVSDGLREFQAELDRDMGHFFSRYSNVDTVQFQLLLHLEREGAGVPFTCAGTTLVDARGNVVMDFTNTAAYLGNEMLRSVRDRRRQLEERYDALLERELEVGLDEKESGELDELVQQIADVTDQESQLQERFLADMRQFVSELADDTQMSPRRRQAIRLISSGRVREGYKLLDVHEIEQEGRMHETHAQAAQLEYHAERAQVLDAVKSLLTRVRVLRTFVEEEGEVKDEEIRHTYAVAIDFERRNGFEPIALVSYGQYLLELGICGRAVDQLEEACAWYRAQLAASSGVQQPGVQLADPLLPDRPALLRGLAKALQLNARACLGGKNPDTAAAGYASMDRVRVMRELYAMDDVPDDVLDYATCLIDAAEVMQRAKRPDDALVYLDEADQLLSSALADAERAAAAEAPADAADPAEGLVQDQLVPVLRIALMRALSLYRDVYAAQGRDADMLDSSLRLVDQRRRNAQADNSAAADALLASELRYTAHESLNRAKQGTRKLQEQAHALTMEALQVDEARYAAQPSAQTAIALARGYVESQKLMARLHDNDAYIQMAAGRLDSICRELRREPSVAVQKAAGEHARDLYFRWAERPDTPMALALGARYSSLASAISDTAAPGEDSFAAGTAVGDAIAAAVAMAEAAYGPESIEAMSLRRQHMERLRAGMHTPRGIALYSGAMDRLARRLREQGRPAEAYGIASERLCALRLACGTEVPLPEPDDKSVDQDTARAEAQAAAPAPTTAALRQLARALYYEEGYAVRHGRPAEAQGLMAEHLDALRQIVADDCTMFDLHQFNGVILRLASYAQESGSFVTCNSYLQEALAVAQRIYDERSDLDSARNLGYVGKEVVGLYVRMGMHDQAKLAQDECLQLITAFGEEHPTAEVADWAATAAWNFVLEACENGASEGAALRDEAYEAYVQMAGKLARISDTAYLDYLRKHLNGMLTGSVKTGINHEVASRSIELASQVFDEREAAGQIALDDARTLSSVYEMGVLITLELGFDDLANDYVDRCVSLYEDRLARAREQGQEALSTVECASQLSKQLSRMAKDMRRFGKPDRAAELWQRAADILRREHERVPGDRISYKYNSMLFHESERLEEAGDMLGALALRRESVEVQDRYRQADPTLRNVLQYVQSLGQLADKYLEAGIADEAAAAEERMLQVLDERHQALHERQTLRRYLGAAWKVSGRLGKRDNEADVDRARKLLERALLLAEDDFSRHEDVEAARPLNITADNLRRLYLSMHLPDEAARMTARQVEVQRFLFSLVPNVQLAKQFSRTLQTQEKLLRARAKQMDRADYAQQANELHDERVSVMHWAAGRDDRIARELVSLLTNEVSIRFSDEPWVLKRMMRRNGEGHGYPLELGEERSRMCLETLDLLRHHADSIQLAQESRDMRGVLVQYLVHRSLVADGSEADDQAPARQREALYQLRQLLHVLEQEYEHDPSAQTAYRLAFFLKLASLAYEASNDDPSEAVAALARRAEVLGEHNRDELSVTSGLKYVHALRDQAELCERTGSLEAAQHAENGRRLIIARLLQRDDLDDADRQRLRKELRACYEHQDKLFEALGEAYADKRQKMLESYVEFLREQIQEQGEEANAYDRRTLARRLSQVAELAETRGNVQMADEWLAQAEALLRDVLADRKAGEGTSPEGADEAGVPSDQPVHDLQLARLLGQHAQMLMDRSQQDDGRPEQADGDRACQRALLDEAFSLIGEETRLSTGVAAELGRLHQLHASLLKAEGQTDRALASLAEAAALMESAYPDDVTVQELGKVQTQLASELQESGQLEQAAQARQHKTSMLQDAFQRTPQTELGLYLAGDLANRAKMAEREGSLGEALALSVQRWQLLTQLDPQNEQQAKALGAACSGAARKLAEVALSVVDALGHEAPAKELSGTDASDAALAGTVSTSDLLSQAQEALAMVERDVAQQARDGVQGAAATHLDLMRRRIEASASTQSRDQQLRQLTEYATQTSYYGRISSANRLDSGALWRHLGAAAARFDELDSPSDAQECRDEAISQLMLRWRRTHDQAVATQLDQVFSQCFERTDTPERELDLVRKQLELVRDQLALGLGKGTKGRVERLTARMLELCEQLGQHRDIAELQLSLVEDAYERAEGSSQLAPIAEELRLHLKAAADALKGLDASYEARWLVVEAERCEANLSRPGISWWRLGEMHTIRRAWTRASELGLAQKRLQRSSHVLYRSFSLGDWDQDDWKHRNLRNLMSRRQQAYAKGLSAEDRAKKLSALRWCLFNAANLLQSKRALNDAYLGESIVLRCEQLEVMCDLMRLQEGTPNEKKARQEYLGELRKLVGLLKGDDYRELAYQDVRRWAEDLIAGLE